MSRDLAQDLSPLEDLSQILDFFQDGCKAPDARALGTEHEKFGFYKDSHKPLVFDDIEALLQKMADKFGWEPAYDQGRLVALERNDEAITLEPGGQIELSGGIKGSVFGTRDELLIHMDEFAAVAPNVQFTCFGLNPFDQLDDVGWVPKSRYGVMRDYLKTRGDLAHWMMKMTCTIQTNLDFTSEADASDLVRSAMLASPFIHAVFANSPIREGKDTGFQSYRGHIWTRLDPDRTGVPSFMLDKGWGFAEYTEYALDVPMFFIRRDDAYINMAGHSFRKFWENGYEGHRATIGDFELHLSTIFPEVRMKQYVEVRCGDGGPLSHMVALPAVWKGLLYDDTSRTQIQDLLGHIAADDLRELFTRASKDGIRAHTNDAPFTEVLESLLTISSQGLERIALRDGHDSEVEFLSPLQEILESGLSAADRLLADMKRLKGDRGAIIDLYELP